MTRNEQQLYSDVTRIKESLKKIANALDKDVKYKVKDNQLVPDTKEIPGFEGTLDALDVLCDIKTITDEYSQSNEALIARHKTKLSSEFQKQDTLTPTSDNPDPAGYGGGGFDGLVEYETDLQGIRVDSDHDIRSTAQYYTEILNNTMLQHTYEGNIRTKKDCILDYVTNEFGALGARYTDIIKFAYYLGAHNSPKYSNSNRGYYSCALNAKLNGHLIQGGKDCLVKGINKEGNERYFALSFVECATDYWKRIA